jgi:sulfur carrier protein ThiS
VLDEQGAVRRHVAVFINGELLHDRQRLERPLAGADRVYVAQALSGG